MNLEELHKHCKDATRKAFNEYKRQIDVALFPFDNSVKDTLQDQMLIEIGNPITKHFVNNYNLSSKQLEYIKNTIDQYRQIALNTSNNYAKRYLIND